MDCKYPGTKPDPVVHQEVLHTSTVTLIFLPLQPDNGHSRKNITPGNTVRFKGVSCPTDDSQVLLLRGYMGLTTAYLTISLEICEHSQYRVAKQAKSGVH